VIDKLHTGYRKAVEVLTRTSPASWVLDLLGRNLVGTPDELQQDSDFWEDTEDRSLPSASQYLQPKVQASQVAGDHFRRHLQRDLALMGSIVALGLCAAIFIASRIAISIVGPEEGAIGALPVAGYSQSSDPFSTDCAALTRQVRQISDRYSNSVTDLSQLSDGEQEIVSNFTINCRGN